MRRSLGMVAWLFAVVAGGGACGTKPPPPPVAEAPKIVEKCLRVGPYAEPLIEGWKSDAREDLDAAMKGGVAVVSYDCHGLKTVKGCKLPGSYAYSGMYRREVILQLTTPEELRANVPLSTPGLIPELHDDRALELAVVTIGKRTTPREVAVKKDLVGTCEGATHYVRSAWIGGIAAGIGKTSKPHTFNEVFTAATGASSTDEYKDGDFEPCRKATSDILSPPQRCSIAVRLELVAIGEGAETKPFDEAAPRPQPCPEGMVLGGGKCALPETQKAFVCAPTDAKECTEQCDKGDAESCYRLGMLMKNGAGATKNPKKARELFEKASTMGGSPRADYELGMALLKEKDQIAAEKLFTKACDVGDAWVCGTVGGYYDQGTFGTKSGTRAVENYRRGCNLGYAPSCIELGSIWIEGRGGVSSDPTGASEVLERTCAAGLSKACGLLGGLYAHGTGVDKDDAKAKELLVKGCDATIPDPETCTTLGTLQESDKDVEKAAASYDKACKGRDLKACARLGALLEKTDKAKAKEHYVDVCARLKDKPSCDRAKKMK